VWLSIAAIAIVVVVAAALFAPITVDVSVEKAGGESPTRVGVRVSWLGLSTPQGQLARRSITERRKKKKRSRSSVRWATVRGVLESPGFFRRCARLLRELGHLAVPDRLQLRGQVGFEDPADTGVLLGWVYAVGARRPLANGWRIQLDPQFTEPILQGRLQLRWSRTIVSIAWPLLKFAVSPVVWRAWMRARHASH
jgi:hypothetical protein